MANRATGKGYENEDNYTNIKFRFLGIENIHVMRNSQQKLIEGTCIYCIVNNCVITIISLDFLSYAINWS